MRPRVLLMFDATFEECAGIQRGISRFQSQHGAWDTFVDKRTALESDESWLRLQQWDGVINRSTRPRFAEVCLRLRIPLVDMNDSPALPGISKVRPDNLAIGHLAAEDLLERGFQNFGFVGYENESWSLERQAGFEESLGLLGRQPHCLLTAHGCTLDPAENSAMVEHLSAWLRSQPFPLGVFAAHDLRAHQVIDAAVLAGLRVPEDVAVLGVNNDLPHCELAHPPLSSIETDMVTAGFLAAQELASLWSDPRKPACDVRVEPARVVTRRSTDLLAIPDRRISNAVAFIRDQAARGITVEGLARRVAISRGGLERGFRHYLGRSPQAEIRRVQIESIKRLLVRTDNTLREIADLIGFDHVESMCVLFKRETGETPGRFRRKAQDRLPAAIASNSPTF